MYKVMMNCLLMISVCHAQYSEHNYCNQYSDYMTEYSFVSTSEQYLPQHYLNSKEQAYLIQSCIVSNKAKKIIGFKAGLVSESSQNKFHSNEPVMGVFVEGDLRDLSQEIYRDNKVSLIEVELAFRLNQSIANLADLNNVMELFDVVAPAIEMPLFHFENTSELTGNDIIAANVGANFFMIGEFALIDDIDFGLLKVGLTENNKIVVKDVEIDPVYIKKSLSWLLKKSYLEGYV